MASMLAVVFSNGSMALFMINKDNPNAPPDCCTLPPAEAINCISWSPKGKQLVAGKANGTLTQYKPDLKEAKTIPAPSGENGPLSAFSILWVSTYQFLVGFKDAKDGRPAFYMVQSSKTGPTNYYNYDDICFSSGDKHKPFFGMTHISDWDVIVCSSSNAIEIGVLGACQDAPGYVQWFLPDAGRAELPLNPANNSERYPTGSAMAYCSQRKLDIDPTRFRETPVPMNFYVTDDFILCGFYVINDAKEAKQVSN